MSSILTRLGSCGRIRSRTSRSAISSVTGWPVSLLWARRRLSAPSRSRPLWVTVLAMNSSTAAGDVEAGMVLSGGGGPAFEDFKAQFLAQRAHFDDQAARKPRSHALVQALEVGRRPVGGDDDLAAGVDEG